MENETKEILNYLGNTHTKLELKEDFKDNYFSYLTDTIYIAKKFEKQKVPNAAKHINKKAAELILICHECIHSKQNELLHILNIIFSNMSIVLAVVGVFIGLLGTSPLWLKIPTIAVIIASITIRLILEVGAINGSTKLATTIVEKTVVHGVSRQDIEVSEKYMNKYKCLVLLKMVLDKIILLILVLVLK